MSITKTNPFLKSALAGLNKTEKDKVTESVTDFVTEARTEITVQIAMANADVLRANGSLVKAEAKLKKAEGAFEKARYDVPADGTLQGYISNRNGANVALDTAKDTVLRAEEAVEGTEKAVKVLEGISKDLA